MLRVVTEEQAVQSVREFAAARRPDIETVPLSRAAGRVLAEDIIAREDIPPFDRTTVDGYAVCAADTFGAGASIPAQLDVMGEIAMGETPAFSIDRGQCARISTGGMLPRGADAAVMVEYTDETDGVCLAYRSVSPRENVVRAGEDVAAGSVVLRCGTRLTAAQVGVPAALGVYDVPVFRKPVVAVISTGDEIAGQSPRAGQIRDVNTFLLCAAAEAFGCDVVRFGVVPDDFAKIRSAVEVCLEKADVVLISGGSSAGMHDRTVDILSELGEVFFHGIAVKPGKPTIFGEAQGKAVFGLPGHPLAAYCVFRLLVCAYLRALLRMAPESPISRGALAVNLPSNHGRAEWVCVRRNDAGEIEPMHTKSGMVSVLSDAQGFIHIPRDAEGLDRGSEVEIYSV